MFAHIALLGFQRAGGSVRRFSSRPLLYTAFPPLQADPAIFFTERQRRMFPDRNLAFQKTLISFPFRKKLREFF
jgi:hypothetical protein